MIQATGSVVKCVVLVVVCAVAANAWRPLLNSTVRVDCGISGHRGMIRGGRPAMIHEYPWMAFLDVYYANGTQFGICTCFFITLAHVLCAAHCEAYSVKGYRLYYGGRNTHFMKHAEVLHQYLPEGMPPYPRDFLFDPDVMILELRTNVAVRPICIAKNITENLDREYAQIIGWGATGNETVSRHRGSRGRLLQVADTVIHEDSDKCDKVVRNKTTQICIYNEEHTACKGDSGGPLMLRRDNKFWAVGVTSYAKDGKLCSDPDDPQVYTRVSAITDFILKSVKSKVLF